MFKAYITRHIFLKCYLINKNNLIDMSLTKQCFYQHMFRSFFWKLCWSAETKTDHAIWKMIPSNLINIYLSGVCYRRLGTWTHAHGSWLLEPLSTEPQEFPPKTPEDPRGQIASEPRRLHPSPLQHGAKTLMLRKGWREKIYKLKKNVFKKRFFSIF